MAQIIPQYSGGGEFGSALGGGFSQGIQDIAQQKMNEYAYGKQLEMQAAQQQKAYETQRQFENALKQQDVLQNSQFLQSSFNLSPQEAYGLASSPQASQIIKELTARGGFGGPQSTAIPQTQPPQQFGFMNGENTTPSGSPLRQAPAPGGEATVPAAGSTRTQPTAPRSISDILSQPKPLSQHDQLMIDLARDKEAATAKRFETQHGYKVGKDTAKIYSDTDTKLNSINERLENNAILLSALESGEVNSPTALKALGFFGLDQVLRNPTTALVENAANNIKTSLIAAYPGKGSFSDKDLAEVSRRVPDILRQGIEGAKVVSKILTLRDLGEKTLETTKRDLINKYAAEGKAIPHNINTLAEDDSLKERQDYKNQIMDLVKSTPSKGNYKIGETIETKGNTLPDPKQYTPGFELTLVNGNKIHIPKEGGRWANGPWKE